MPVDLRLKKSFVDDRKAVSGLRTKKAEGELTPEEELQLRRGMNSAHFKMNMQVPNADVQNYVGEGNAYEIAPSTQSASEQAAVSEVAKAAAKQAVEDMVKPLVDEAVKSAMESAEPVEDMVKRIVEEMMGGSEPDTSNSGPKDKSKEATK